MITPMLRALLLCAALVAGCKQESGADPAEVETSGPTKGSAGGFSASLSAEMGGSGSAGAEAAGSGLSRTASGTAPKADAGSGSGSGSAMAAKTEPPKTEPPKVEPPKAGSGSGSAVVVAPPKVEPPKPAIAMTPELRAIKLSLLANWDRDVVEPATISLFEKNSNTTFTFHYGYEDPKAPTDRDAYKKWLADNKILTPRIDRQSGAAWYLEGADGSGRGVFRIVVTYGGKKLICFGSTYKDSALGDLRDNVVSDAKKICETIQL